MTYTHNNKTYELLVTGKSRNTYREVKPDGSKGEPFTSSEIKKHGKEIKPDDNQKQLF